MSKTILEVPGMCGDGGMPITVTIEGGEVHVKGAMRVVTEIPISTKYKEIHFTTAYCDEPKRILEIIVTQKGINEIDVSAGLLSPGMEDYSSIEYPGLNIKGQKVGNDLLLRTKVHRAQLDFEIGPNAFSLQERLVETLEPQNQVS